MVLRIAGWRRDGRAKVNTRGRIRGTGRFVWRYFVFDGGPRADAWVVGGNLPRADAWVMGGRRGIGRGGRGTGGYTSGRCGGLGRGGIRKRLGVRGRSGSES